MLRIFKYVFKYPLLLFLGSLSMLLVIGIDQITPMIQKIFIDDAIIESKHSLILPLILSLLIATIIKSCLGFFKEFIYDYMSVKVHAQLKYELFDKIQSLEFAYFDHMNTGELMSRIGEDVENIFQSIGYGIRLFLENIIYFTMSTIILFHLNAKLTVICLAIMLPIGLITLRVEKQFGTCYGKISDQNAIINTTAQENIAGVRLIKAFTREQHEIKKFFNLNKRNYDLNMQLAQTTATYFPIIDFLTNMALVAMIIVGGYFVLSDQMSLGTLTAFNSYIWFIISPLRMLGWLSDLLSRTRASAQKIFKILDRPTHIASPSSSYSPKKVKGTICFKNVSFKYNEEIVLKNIDLTVPSGSTVAIMGTTGSGKSSLINLIGRFYDVCEGEVLIDGVDVKKWDLDTLRSNLSIVMQDTFLFSDSITNNVKFSTPSAAFEEVQTACEIACASEFVNTLENGFDSLIGERGLGLSGGQKQRLAIARALTRKSPILILDDATSALDTETEFELLDHLRQTATEATTFIIAHRISAVKNADLIIYLENGQIVEKGSHKQLLAKKGHYYETYKTQLAHLN